MEEIRSLRQMVTSAQTQEPLTSVSPDETPSDIKVDYTLGIFQAIGRHLLHTLAQADYGVR